MSDLTAAKNEILRDLDRALLNLEGVEQKPLPIDKQTGIAWAIKILRVARKSIAETLDEL